MREPPVHFVAAEAARPGADALFARVCAAILRVLPGADVQHIGATSVPGLITRGDLDVCVRVPAGDFGAAEREVALLYARNEGNDLTATYAAFLDAGTRPPLGVQLVAAGGPEDMFVRLRDLLRARPDLVASLNGLKARHEGAEAGVYRSAKSAWIERVLGGQ